MAKLLLSIFAVAALSCAGAQASQPSAGVADVSDGTPVAGYRFVKTGGDGRYYIDYEAMGEEARDDGHFAALSERFIADDPALGVEDLQVLYYGRTFRDDREATGLTCADIEKAAEEGDYDKAYAFCLDLQRHDPASPQLLRLLHESASKKSMPAAEPELSALERRYRFVLDVISYSGNGTMLAPYIVVSAGDEYELMHGRLGITDIVMRQQVGLDDGTPCDVVTVGEGEGSDSENDEVWFDISMSPRASDKLSE